MQRLAICPLRFASLLNADQARGEFPPVFMTSGLGSRCGARSGIEMRWHKYACCTADAIGGVGEGDKGAVPSPEYPLATFWSVPTLMDVDDRRNVARRRSTGCSRSLLRDGGDVTAAVPGL